MAFSIRGGRRPGTWRGGATRRRLAPTLWLLLVAAALAVPWWILVTIQRAEEQGAWRVLSLATSLAAASLLVAAFVLPSRLRALTSHLGVERLLRQHRALAVVGVALVVAHVAFVLAHSEQGWRSSTCARHHPASGPPAWRRWPCSPSSPWRSAVDPAARATRGGGWPTSCSPTPWSWRRRCTWCGCAT